MATENNPFAGLIKAVEAALIAEGIHIGEVTLKNVFHKHADKIMQAAKDVHPCPTGYIWSDIAGKCVPDIG